MSREIEEDEMRRIAIIRRARVEGIEVAYESALEVCRNKDAPAQAKSNASRTLLQIGGLFDRADRQIDNLDKDMHEMNAEELTAYRIKLERQNRSLGALSHDDADNAFD
jgi:hypothetical protein